MTCVINKLLISGHLPVVILQLFSGMATRREQVADLRCFSVSRESRIDHKIVLSMKIPLAKLADVSKVVN